jgi:hypothetical protein
LLPVLSSNSLNYETTQPSRQICLNPTGGIQMATKKAKAPAKTRPKGVTREEVLALTQWPSVSLQAVTKAAGVKLRVDNEERPYRYHAASRGRSPETHAFPECGRWFRNRKRPDGSAHGRLKIIFAAVIGDTSIEDGSRQSPGLPFIVPAASPHPADPRLRSPPDRQGSKHIVAMPALRRPP